MYPAEVERVLLEHPAVDARRGARACPTSGWASGWRRWSRRLPGRDLDVDDVRAHLLANLAKYKVPEQITVVDALPRNAMGKIVRTELPALLGGEPTG